MRALPDRVFLLWFYKTLDSTGRKLDTFGKHYAIAIIERELKALGFTTGYEFDERVFGPYDAQLQEDFDISVRRGLLRGDGSRGEPLSSPMLTEIGESRLELLCAAHLKETLGVNYPILEQRMREILRLSPAEILQLSNT